MANEQPGSRINLIGKGNLRLFKRKEGSEDSNFWASFKFPKRPRINRSLGTSDIDAASREAHALYASYQKRLEKYGDLEIGKSTTLNNLYQQFVTDSPTSKRHGEWRANIIDDHMHRLWFPYLGKRIQVKPSPSFERKLAQYVQWRRGKKVGNKQPYQPSNGERPKAAKNSLRLEYQSIQQVMRHAKRKGLIDAVPEVDFKSLDLEWTKDDQYKSRRAAFLPEEVRKMPDLFDAWVNQEKVGYRSNHKWSRQRLKGAVLIAASSGMRPNELRQLKNQDLEFKTDKKGREVLFLRIGRSKGQTKTTIHSTPCQFFGDPTLPVKWMRDWLDIQAHKKRTDFVFANRNGLQPRHVLNQHFIEFLETHKMRYDKPTGVSRGRKTRNLYALRHFHISELVSRGANVPIIAKGLGTSSEMIENSYLEVHDENLEDAFLD